MGFCGCSNHASVVTAAIFGIVFSIYGIAWTSSAISLLTESYISTPFYNNFFVFSNIQYIKTDTAILVLIIVTLCLHIVWFVSSILLAYGNEGKKPSYLKTWIPVSSIILLADVGSSIYCVSKALGPCDDVYLLFNKIDVATKCIVPYFAYLLLAILFEKGGLITIGIQIALTICVSNRAREINDERMRPQQAAVLSPTVGYTMPVQNYVIGPTFQQPNPVNYGYAQGWNEPAPPPPYGTSVANAQRHIPYAKLSGGEAPAPRNPLYREFHSQDDLSTGPRY